MQPKPPSITRASIHFIVDHMGRVAPAGMRHVAAGAYTRAMARAHHRKEIVRTEAYNIHIIGAPAPGLRDLYHALLRVPWWAAFAVIVGTYLALNGVFAALYLWVGG